ncbi:peptidoglycan editing factor PgeF [Patescibacteria group bacterium]|nr:peptidoglycan editing factor PgeF [Patescibacteria group bacterium]MBU4016933.1 peptidoglycan editing factor PgeF [Patescibacteria group bacterium]MBU4098912.1 peptidoglycan editing factor PgeF [Patescibacteria group bacterium]
MINKTVATGKNNIIRFKNLSKINDLIHGFSTREFGSMKPGDPDSNISLELFSKALKINPQQIIKMRQIHSNNIRWVTQKDRGFRINEVDGLLTREKDVYLSVLSADCIPVLIFDKQKKYAGAVHAGWKGIYNDTLKAAINQLISNGSNPVNVLIGIGPCIRSCCYNITITNERANLFNKKYIYERNGSYFLDLPKIAKEQLLSVGIPKNNIEDCNICTSDNNDRFFSFRKEGERFGEFMGIIGRKS